MSAKILLFDEYPNFFVERIGALIEYICSFRYFAIILQSKRKGCDILYSTGTITASNATGSSAVGEVGVIEGDNSININNNTFTSGPSSRDLMILQSGSGDSEGYNGAITITGSTITLTDSSITNNGTLDTTSTNVTGIHEITASGASNSKDGIIYNLQGQKVASTGEALSSLPHGIYVMNGKKFMVK